MICAGCRPPSKPQTHLAPWGDVGAKRRVEGTRRRQPLTLALSPSA